MRLFGFLLLCCCSLSLRAQDTEWFPGGDDAFYRYLEDRLQASASSRPYTLRNGENVIFEFVVTDSGYVDSVKLGTCFNVNLCIQLRLILNTMPRVNAKMVEGKPVPMRRIYNVIVRSSAEGYRVEPAPQQYYSRPSSSQFKWGLALLAVVIMLIAVVK